MALVELDGVRYTIRARVETIGGYSAHADRKDLLNFVRRMRHPPAEVRLVHGDGAPRLALKGMLEQWASQAGHELVVTLGQNS